MTLDATAVAPDERIFSALQEVLIDSQLDVVDDWRREVAAGHSLQFKLLKDGDWVIGAGALTAGAPGSPASLTTVCSAFDSVELETLLDAFDLEESTEWWVRGASLRHAIKTAQQRNLPLSRQIDKMVSNIALKAQTVTTAFDVADSEALAAVNNAAFADHKDRAHWTRQTVLDEVATLKNEPGDIRLHKVDGRLAGFVWTRSAGPHSGEIQVLAVHPAFSGSGLGRQLLAAGVQHLRDKGASRTFLYVDADNIRAKRIYESAGFVDVEESLVSYLIEPK